MIKCWGQSGRSTVDVRDKEEEVTPCGSLWKEIGKLRFVWELQLASRRQL